MRLNNIITVLPIFALLCSCQTEAPQVDPAPKRIITVKASLPGSDNTRSWITYGNAEHDTRAQITYGNENPDEEVFMWDKKGYGGLENNDCLALYNVTRLSQCPTEGIQLDIKESKGRNATFQSVREVDPEIEIKAGDQIFVNYWASEIVQNSDYSYDDRKIFKINLNPKPQLVVENPTNESLAYMQSNLKMYDVVTIEKDDSIPDIHFKHLSAIMRVTFRNETDSAFWPKELKFDYPGTESFFNNSLYCSVDSESEDGSGLKIYPNLDGLETYTDIVKSDINNYTAAATEKGTFLKKGQSYDLYLSCVPRIANKTIGEKMIITLQHRIDSEKTKDYSMTLDGFDVPIEAGCRYWFNLTAVDDEDGTGKLIFTSKLADWLKDHPKKDPDNGEQNPSGD